MAHRPIEIIAAPCNLGLRPPGPGKVPGTWRAPEVLLGAGVARAVGATVVTQMARPHYSPEPQAGTRLYNGPELRRFNLALADEVERAVLRGAVPLVIGGDCSILLGALVAMRRRNNLSLIHIDGHSDFRHPGNYDANSVLGAVGGMDLALATGHGEDLMTSWPGIAGPLVPERHVVQLGERESHNKDFAWPDVIDTDMNRIDVFEARTIGTEGVLARMRETLDLESDWPFWLHLDVDVLDQSIIPAVDSPGSPGIDPAVLVAVCRSLVKDSRWSGMTLTIFDPDLDPSGDCAQLIVALCAEMLGAAGEVTRVT
jgi:arginase